jgi:hypothetical protein
VEYADDFQRIALGAEDDYVRQAGHGPFARTRLAAYATDIWKIAQEIETRPEPLAYGLRGQRPVRGYICLDFSKMR